MAPITAPIDVPATMWMGIECFLSAFKTPICPSPRAPPPPRTNPILIFFDAIILYLFLFCYFPMYFLPLALFQ